MNALRRRIPVRAWLVWHALRGNPIAYRVRFERGTFYPERGAFIARFTFVGSPAIEFSAGEVHLGTTLNLR